MKQETAVLARRARSPRSFFIFRDGEEDGPFSLEHLQEMHGSGEFPASAPCRDQKDREWHDLGYILRLMEDSEDAEAVAEAQSGAASSTTDRPRAKSAPVASVRPRRSADHTTRDLVAELVSVTRRQNQLLSSIKWSLLGLVMILVAGGVALGFR